MKGKKNKKFTIVPKILVIVLLLIIISNFFLAFQVNSTQYTRTDYWQRFPNLKKVYLDSQYANKKHTEWIPDTVVNAYAGGAYIQGISPVLIAPDTPPLGRYLVGVSTVLFHNENTVNLIAAIISVLLLYILCMQIMKNKLYALITVAFISSEPIFKNQIIFTPLLDILQLNFLLLTFYFFNKAIKSTKYYGLFFAATSISIGLFISTKFFATGPTLIGACVLVLLLHRQWRKLFIFIVTLPLALLTLLGSYSRVLYFDQDLRKFLGIQKYVLLYHKSQLILPFTIWPLLLLNKWYVWWGDVPVLSDDQWRLTWPIITICAVVTIILYSRKKIKHIVELEVMMVWAILYILFFSIGQVSSRYLVIYIPILYIISVYGIQQLIEKKFSPSKK